MLPNRRAAYINVKRRVELAEAFLKRIAEHLEENGMPGQAGNCILQSRELESALTSLEFLRRKEFGE